MGDGKQPMKPPNIDHDEQRSYCLFFHDAEARRDLGACIVDVSGSDAMIEWLAYPNMHNQEDGPWISAAIREAWSQGCNPGGSVMAGRMSEATPEWLRQLEHNRLYSDAEMLALDQSQRASEPRDDEMVRDRSV